MKTESLSVILEMQMENTLLKRGIEEMSIMLLKKEIQRIPVFDIAELKILYRAVESTLKQIENKQQPSNETDNPDCDTK